MSDVLIKGMGMPKDNDYLLLIIQNGKVHKAISCGHLTTDELNVAEAVELPDSSWHTGTPTEEGWYLIAFLGANKRIEYASAVWCYNEWDAHCRILAWQKIEPYNPEANYQQINSKQ